ncbi:MAG: gluconeogenesis factor YvcK family protein [Acidimicrobiales bacterium]
MSRPAVVAVGGGHGLAATLRACRRYAGRVTAVVSVADDGGSSGRLRAAFGLPAPGDLRRCLTALADDQSVWRPVLDHRFDAGELEGHALGNLLIAGLYAVTGDFVASLDEVGRLLGAAGRVLPATCETVVLKAETAEGTVDGQVRVQEASGIRRVSLVPDDPEATPDAVTAIADADQVILGPGSLFTSVLAAAIVPGIRTALTAAEAQLVYVANLREQAHETVGFDLADHLQALLAHDVRPDVVLADPDGLARGDATAIGIPVVERALARTDLPAHDPARLAAALADLHASLGSAGEPNRRTP